ncbi:MAG: DUF2889 domain-containing protein [Gammaproteobacteria bacterium]|nr:DUF2889 domain-containing protein [Gammaproteobacteria bacterium]
MPLSPATDRKLAHTRVVTCTGYRRNDGLWDIEGRIVDTKPYGFPNRDRGGRIEAEEALHDMSIRLTVNNSLEVKAVEAIIDASPYNYCKSVTDIANNLVGLSIAPGWAARSKIAMGKNRGCTHLTELLGPIATTAIQTLTSERMKKQHSDVDNRNNNHLDDRWDRKSPFIDSCYSLAADSPVVEIHWPDQYQSLPVDGNSDS